MSSPTSLKLRRGRAYDPFDHADQLGLQVIFRPIRTAHELVLPPEYATIVVRSGMRSMFQRNALAHGIAHWTLGHRDDRPKFENQADRVACLYLIEPKELAALTGWTNDHAVIAQELDVTERHLSAFLAAQAG